MFDRAVRAVAGVFGVRAAGGRGGCDQPLAATPADAGADAVLASSVAARLLHGRLDLGRRFHRGRSHAAAVAPDGRAERVRVMHFHCGTGRDGTERYAADGETLLRRDSRGDRPFYRRRRELIQFDERTRANGAPATVFFFHYYYHYYLFLRERRAATAVPCHPPLHRVRRYASVPPPPDGRPNRLVVRYARARYGPRLYRSETGEIFRFRDRSMIILSSPTRLSRGPGISRAE